MPESPTLSLIFNLMWNLKPEPYACNLKPKSFPMTLRVRVRPQPAPGARLARGARRGPGAARGTARAGVDRPGVDHMRSRAEGVGQKKNWNMRAPHIIILRAPPASSCCTLEARRPGLRHARPSWCRIAPGRSRVGAKNGPGSSEWGKKCSVNPSHSLRLGDVSKGGAEKQ